MFIPHVITKALSQQPILMTRGEQTRDINHVTDIVEGDSLSVTINACNDAGNGVTDTITLTGVARNASAAATDTDINRLTEQAGDGGIYLVTIGTDATDSGDSPSVLRSEPGGTIEFSSGAATALVTIASTEPEACSAPPTIPAGFSMTGNGGKDSYSVTLDWDEVIHNTDEVAIAASYEIYEKEDGDPYVLVAAPIAGHTSYTRTTRKKLKNAVYTYRMRSINGSCSSPKDVSGFTGEITDPHGE